MKGYIPKRLLPMLEPVRLLTAATITCECNHALNPISGRTNTKQSSIKRPYDKVCTYVGLKAYDAKSPYDKYAGLPVYAKAHPNA